ncbi:dihydrofolate reductase [Paenibacillus glycanilyticus]|uniref:dihydrofolate reductase n=1 Tax=Paenibacillus glycanilyticus TaxID=126569 RepID=UPI00203F302B|nr:dihydrofolate reductase [Paenibacillus glycanilyticus]MCM3629949.1 dihydrofolate reductase [Paenibacillus glycanilyticus]
MTITMIAAMDRSRTIGIGNKLPWRLPAEMAYFTRHTTGKVVVMGRKTFESLPKPLKDRTNVVITRNSAYVKEGCEIVHSVQEAIERYGNGELMVIGGADIYEQFLPFANKLLLTEVDTDIAGGDAFFPSLNEAEWERVDAERVESDEKNAYSFIFQTFARRQA